MHFPFDIVIGEDLVIPIHFVFDVLSMYIGYKYYLYLCAKKQVIKEDQPLLLLIGAAIGAFLGAKSIALLEVPHFFLHPPNSLYYFTAGKTVVGGIAGGILGVEFAKKVLAIKHSTGGLVTFPLIWAMVIGRIGCFLTGVTDNTVGKISTVPWAFDQGDGFSRHPTALYEILFLLILYFFLRHARNNDGISDFLLFRLFIIAYFSFRVAVEFLKPVYPLFLGVTAIQWVCIFFVLYYGISILTRKTYGTGA